MGLFSFLFKKEEISAIQIQSRETYNFLVVAALQEELNAFLTLISNLKKVGKKAGGAVEYQYSFGKRQLTILTFSCNKMGMPFNSAALMRIVMIHQPIYTFFIGTCAGLHPSKQKTGDVLVPHFIFNHESGKYNDKGEFESDYMSFDTDEEIRKSAEIIKNKVSKQFNVTTDDNFCSGGAIVDDKVKKENILKESARKVSGLDMEAFSVACINSILKSEGKKLGVIKGIMDFGENRTTDEREQGKKLAMLNSAKFVLELIEYIDEDIMGSKEVVRLQ